MKNAKKILVLVLAGLMILSLSGCGMFEMQLLKGVKNMAKLQSLHADAQLELTYSVGLATGNIELDSSAKVSADVQREPLSLMAETEFSLFGLSGRIHSFARLADENLTLAISLDGENWESRVTEGFSLSGSGLGGKTAAGAVKYLSGFEKQKNTELIDGREAVSYKGSLSGRDIREILSMSGLDGVLSKNLRGFDTEKIDDSLELPLTVALCRKTGMPLRIEADFKELADVFARCGMNSILGLPEDADLDIEAENALLKISFSQFDSAAQVVNPVE